MIQNEIKAITSNATKKYDIIYTWKKSWKHSISTIGKNYFVKKAHIELSETLKGE